MEEKNTEKKKQKAKSRIRNKLVRFFVTEKELEKINKKTEKAKVNRSEYLRRSALNKDIILVEGLKEISVELIRIGNNINQMVKLEHQRKTGKFFNKSRAKEIRELKDELDEVKDIVYKLVKSERIIKYDFKDDKE